MIRLYGLNTPNTHKITIALEELALPYEIEVVDVRSDAPLSAEFKRISPNGKVPAIIDTDTGTPVFESGAILLYLASKAERLMPYTPAERWQAIQWLFFQTASMGPMLGQRAWFNYYAGEAIPYAIKRYDAQVKRLYGVLEQRLSTRDFICDSYSIVDIAHFGWLHCAHAMHLGFEDFPALTAWYQRVLARPAVQRGVRLPAQLPTWHADRKLSNQETLHV